MAAFGRSGPAPDPNSFRQNRKDAGAWVTLDIAGFQGDVPNFPLGDPTFSELELWATLWRKPQAIMWDKLNMHFQLAAYVRAFVESTLRAAPAGLKSVVLQMEGQLGISLPGMHSLHWKFSDEQIVVDEVSPVRITSSSALKDRLRAS